MGIKEFQILNKLGEGAFSSVYKVKRISDGQEYAMKKVKMSSLSEKEKQNALNEVRILASINNPYIVGYKEAFFEDNSMTLCVVMEYAGGGDLYNKIVQHQKARTYFKEEDIWAFATQMISGLKTLHDIKIIHRDLKSANIFLASDRKTIKLGDLNVSIVAKTNLVRTQTGTPYYASPEVWQDKPYDSRSDIWSLGCVLYELCALKPPFRANDMQGLFKKIQKGVYEKIPSHYSSDLSDLIGMCLKVSPSSRPSCDRLLSHPLLLKNGKEVIQSLNDIDDTIELLGTIKLPRNIRALQDKLPKAKYREEAKSQDFDHGSLNKLVEENEKNLAAKRPKRPYSQHSRDEEKIVPIKVPQKQSRVPSSRRENLEERPARKLVMENLVEKVRPRDRSPKAAAKNDENGKPPHYIVRPGRNVVESRNNNENMDPNRERPKEVSRQAYLINKYSSNNGAQLPEDKYSNPRVLDRIYSNDAISKRAEDIVKKYYADAQALAERREPLQELRRPSANNSNAADILDRYNNIYNYRAPSSKRVHGGLHMPDEYISRNYLANDNQRIFTNQLRQQVEQGRGVIRPSWWG